MELNNLSKSPQTNRLNINIDLKWVVLLLLVIIAVMMIMWKPWAATAGASDRTISVTGQTSIKAEPDEYVFYPGYEFKNASKDAALGELTKKSEEVVNKLKKLGVSDNSIKTDSSGYDYDYFYDSKSGDNRYSLRLTVTVNSKELAQKVQDYLISTAPIGSVSPQAGFSKAKRKELESKARDEATKDAHAKADQSASNLGFKVGKVKSIDDSGGLGLIMPYARSAAEPAIALDSQKSSQSLDIQPGQNELPYSITVIYFLN